MIKPFGRTIGTASMMLVVGLLSCALSFAQTEPVPFPSSKWNRVLIVSGGPNPQYNQYAIESNARYVAALTNNAKWRRILFADGKPTSKTISTIAEDQNTKAASLAAGILRITPPTPTTIFTAPTLTPIDGASTPESITQNLADFTAGTNANSPQLVYFTGHGSPGQKSDKSPDYVNTLYNAWGQNYAVPQLANSLQATTSSAPLVLIMVQCYGGGFANILFQDGNPTKPIWNHDFCGFFAAIPQRMAAGCTPEVNERNYQDFTTHFFAALSGVSRDGRRVTGADYDGNGSVSLDEAYCYAQINDDSIDVPLSTTDAYLRAIFPADPSTDWQNTPFSTILNEATPQQAAVLNQLSEKLGLGGQDRLRVVQDRITNLSKTPQRRASTGITVFPEGVDKEQFTASYTRLTTLLKDRFPGAEKARAAQQKQILADASALLLANPTDFAIVYNTLALNGRNSNNRNVEEARLLRFLREGRSIILAKRLQQTGTPGQKAVLARLHTSESRTAF